jgi:hypothetical protein
MTMDKSKHTPGPWERAGLSVCVFNRGGIANCPTPQDGGVFECSANARLIAAAPDMLAALQELKNATDAFGREVDYGAMTRFRTAWLRAGDAIAKATSHTSA